MHENLIAGEWVGTDRVENINPSNTNEVVGVYARAGADDAKNAIAAAKAAFPALSLSAILERHAILKKGLVANIFGARDYPLSIFIFMLC